jgi:tetratricopeptide (TPR) repeat protein
VTQPAAGKAKPHAPMTQAELATNDGEIAIGNLEGSVRSAEARLKERPQDPIAHALLAAVLAARAQYRGLIADYERALQITEQMVKLAPQNPRSYLSRAQLRSVFHDFAGVQADLEKAAALAKAQSEPGILEFIDERRPALLRAEGQLDAALALVHKQNQRRPHILSMGFEAALLGERGDLPAADELFTEAQRHDPDVTPFPLAWLYLQHGLLWETAGNLARAHELYAAAHERLPAYAAVTAHLAGTLAARAERDKAIALLRPLVKSSDDPEYAGQLAALLKEAGQEKEAEELRDGARRRYAELLARHPAAFASHAARFFLSAGDAAAAAKWAESNLKISPTAEAHALAVEATVAAGQSRRACELADALGKLPHVLPRMHVLAARAYKACGKEDLMAAELNKAANKTEPNKIAPSQSPSK